MVGRSYRVGWLLFICLALASALAPASAAACSVDGVASLSANGNTASLTGTPSGSDLAHWAPFTLIAAAPGDTLHLAENMGKIRGVLPREVFAFPFHWTFGDGTAQAGREAMHRYARTGRYTITVSYYWPSRHRWVIFDRAEQSIVPKGDLWRANLGFYVGKVFLFIMRLVIWGTAAILLAAAIVITIRNRSRHGDSSTAQHHGA